MLSNKLLLVNEQDHNWLSLLSLLLFLLGHIPFLAGQTSITSYRYKSEGDKIKNCRGFIDRQHKGVVVGEDKYTYSLFFFLALRARFAHQRFWKE